MCFLPCFLRCFLRCFYSLADSGERRKPRRTGHFGARGGQDKECVFKQSWPSTAEYRMMKFKKKKKTQSSGTSTALPLVVSSLRAFFPVRENKS